MDEVRLRPKNVYRQAMYRGDGIEQVDRRQSITDSLWDTFSKSDELGWRTSLQTAMYSGVVNAVIGVFVILLIFAFFVLQFFWKPLLWAALGGLVLFPLKKKGTDILKGWLKEKEEDEMPFIFGICLIPIHAFSRFCDYLESAMFKWKKTSTLVFLYAVCVWMYYNSPWVPPLDGQRQWNDTYNSLAGRWDSCYQLSALIMKYSISKELFYAALCVLVAAKFVLYKFKRIYAIITAPTKLEIVLYLSNLIVGETVMLHLLRLVLFASVFFCQCSWIILQYIFVMIVLLGQVSVPYFLVWIIIVVVEFITRPLGLNKSIKPISERFNQFSYVIVSIVAHAFGPLTVWLLLKFGRKGKEENEEEDDSSPESETSPSLEEKESLPDPSVDTEEIDGASPHPFQKQKKSILKKRMLPKLSWKRIALSLKSKKTDSLSNSWDNASLKARRMSVVFADGIRNFLRKEQSASEEEDMDSDHDGDETDTQTGPQVPLQEDEGLKEGEKKHVSFTALPTNRSFDSQGISQQYSVDESLESMQPTSSAPSLEEPTCEDPEESQRQRKLSKSKRSSKKKLKTIFSLLFGACMLTIFLTQDWTALIFVLMVAWVLIKRTTGVQLSAASSKIWAVISPIVSRNIPQPIQAISKILDRYIILSLSANADVLVTVLIVTLMLIAIVALPLFLGLELYLEAFHYVSVSGRATEKLVMYMKVNATDNETAINEITEQGYQHARTWLQGQIEGFVTENSDNETNREKLVEELLSAVDSIYGIYINGNATSAQIKRKSRRRWFHIQKPANIKQLVSENMKIFTSVLQSAWTVLSQNMHILSSILKSFLAILLHSGRAIISFLFSFFIFLSTLFYLLSYSGQKYLLVDLLSSLTPRLSSSSSQQSLALRQAGNALTSAYRSVFQVTFLMALFYGLYTWLIHKLFNIRAAILPAVLASLFAIMPITSPYFAALPAVLELVLVEVNWLAAIFLFILHLLPPFFVDTYIYSEIEGAHPYITALAIVGGVYFAGLEGAIFGPLLFCTLKFFVNIYAATVTGMKQSPYNS